MSDYQSIMEERQYIAYDIEVYRDMSPTLPEFIAIRDHEVNVRIGRMKGYLRDGILYLRNSRKLPFPD